MNKSNREISALMNLQPQEATRLIGDQEEIVSISDLQIGDLLLVKPGERVPSDGIVVSGQTTIDQAAITGESVPVLKQLDDEVFAGTVNVKGAITIKMTKPSAETLFQKIIQLVQTAQSEKSPSQLFIERFEGTYVKLFYRLWQLCCFSPLCAWMELDRDILPSNDSLSCSVSLRPSCIYHPCFAVCYFKRSKKEFCSKAACIWKG